MDDKGRVLLGVGVVGGSLLLWKLLGKKAEEGIVPSGEISWVGSAYGGYAGISYAYENYANVATVTVTNASTRGGVPCDYTFQVGVNVIDVFGNSVSMAFVNKTTLPLGPGGTGSINIPIPIQPGYFGSMTATAILMKTDGASMVASSLPLSINVVEDSPIAGLALSTMVIWSTTLGSWSSFVNNMSIALPGYNEFRAYWINNLTINVAGYVLVSVETPTGTKIFLTTNFGQNTIAIPGSGSWVGFVGPTIGIPGTYKYTISVYTISGSTYTLRDRVKRNLIVL